MHKKCHKLRLGCDRLDVFDSSAMEVGMGATAAQDDILEYAYCYLLKNGEETNIVNTLAQQTTVGRSSVL